jgi:ABC-type transport system involved in Fe-S cluster assembly fused permease/ATPase subunit
VFAVFVYFDVPLLATVVFVCLVAYADLTIRLTNWRKSFRTSMNAQDNKWHDRLTDSLVNFETVKYFTNEAYERQQFTAAVHSFQSFSLDVKASLSVLNVIQQLILNGCLAAALVLAAQAYHTGAMDGNKTTPASKGREGGGV